MTPPKKKETYTDWEDEVLDSIVWWEQMHHNWLQDPKWKLQAPHYGELCAEIVASKYRFIERRKEVNYSINIDVEDTGRGYIG